MLYNKQIEFKNWCYRRDDTHICIYRKETISYLGNKYKFNIDILINRLIVKKRLPLKGVRSNIANTTPISLA